MRLAIRLQLLYFKGSGLSPFSDLSTSPGSLSGITSRRFVDDLDASAATPGALQSALEHVERKALSACPHERLQIELHRRAARIRSPTVAALGHRTELQGAL